MKLLFDTHTFIWWDSEPDKLSPNALELLSDRTNLKLLSMVSIWEIQIKYQLGKLSLNLPLQKIIDDQINQHNIQLLSITLDHVLALNNLPFYHKDPFDRLLIAQANIEQVTLISCDSIFNRYSVVTQW